MNQKRAKKYFLTSAIILASFLCVPLVFAQYSGDSTRTSQQSGQLYIPDIVDINKIIVEQERQAQIAELRKKINQIQDFQKRYLANKITNNIDFAHKTWVNHFNIILGDLEDIIVKIESRMAKAELNNKDVSKVKVAVENAKRSVEIAKASVYDYENKIYVVNASRISVNSSTQLGQVQLVSALKNQFEILKDQIKEDTFSIRDGVVKDAKDYVRIAFLELADVPEVDKYMPIR